jgi:hypothetical protein
MAYCGQCGAELPASGKFCMKCGSAFQPGAAPVAPYPGVRVVQQKRSSHGNLEACVLAALAVYGVAGILSVLVGNPIGVIVSVLLCVVLGFAYQKLRQHDYQMVQYLCLGAGIVAGLLVLVDLAMGSAAAALINVVAAIPLGYTWYDLRTIDKGRV